MATLKTTNRRGVTLLAFPEDHKLQVVKTICDATGLSRADAEQGVENLPAKFTALFDDDALAADLEALGATVAVTRVPPSSESIICATGEQQVRAWRLAELLASLGNGAVDDDGVNRHAVLLAADYARQLADGLDTVNLLKRGEELATPVEQPAAECEGMQS